MAERHVRAVQLHSKIDDRLTRNILEIIALDIGRDDKPAYTSSRIIAKRARCAVNTARERIEDILKLKELMRTIEGRYSVYSLNPELIPYDSVAEETHEDGGVTAQFARVDDLAAMEKRMYQNIQDCINPLYQMYQTIVSIVSVNQRATDTEVLGKINTYKSINGKNGISHKTGHPEQVNQIIMALESVAKTVFDSDTEAAFVDAAWRIIGWDGTPEQVRGFADWWETNRSYPGLPALKSVMTEYRNYVSGVAKVQASNGTVNTATDSAGGFYG